MKFKEKKIEILGWYVTDVMKRVKWYRRRGYKTEIIRENNSIYLRVWRD